MVLEWDDHAQTLAEHFGRGLTLVVKKDPAIDDLVTTGSRTVAVRMPANPIAHSLSSAGRRRSFGEPFRTTGPQKRPMCTNSLPGGLMRLWTAAPARSIDPPFSPSSPRFLRSSVRSDEKLRSSDLFFLLESESVRPPLKAPVSLIPTTLRRHRYSSLRIFPHIPVGKILAFFCLRKAPFPLKVK